MNSFYITGTDTGIGKTVVSTALLHALRAQGFPAIGMKPVASGCTQTAQGWRNEDAQALWQASEPQPAYADLNPYALPQPLAPEIAAREAGVQVELADIVAAFRRLQASAAAIVVEGVGGWDAPLASTLYQADVVRALRLPVVMVVGLRLGCLNHALLTAEAIGARGLTLAGWVANRVDPDMEAVEDNIAYLRARLNAPLLADVPYQELPEPNSLVFDLPKDWQ